MEHDCLVKVEVSARLQPLTTYTVKLCDKERFDKEQIGVKEPFPVTNLPV